MKERIKGDRKNKKMVRGKLGIKKEAALTLLNDREGDEETSDEGENKRR